MYKSLKRITKLIIPKQLLQKNEFFFRKLISLKYKGDTHQCNICKTKLSRFVNLEEKDLLCPRCGSRSRTRRLYKILNEDNLLTGQVLHFSPPRSLYEKLKKRDGLNYSSSDFENEFVADYNYDITSIEREADSFNLIICYHVLEHIEDDKQAIKELYRVLKPAGLCYIQTPYKDGDIYEDSSIIKEDDRKTAFGQEDHVRIYSVEGLKKRLDAVGFETEIRTFKPNSFEYNGLKEETILVAKKRPNK